MSEVICIHVGGTGVKLGQSVFDLLSVEHGIDRSGELIQKPSECTKRFFNVNSEQKYQPRAVFVDLDPKELDEMTNSYPFGELGPEQIVRGKDKEKKRQSQRNF